MFTRILVAYDGSPAATAALGIGIGLAKRLSAELHSVSVQERLPRYAATIGEVQVAKEEAEKYFRTLTKQARDRALLAGVVLETVTSRGREADTILDVAREGRFDLLLAGYRGHGRLVE
jgi:nucleotide-binding universal stress UspA family protein